MNEPVAETVDELLKNVAGALKGLCLSKQDLESSGVVTCFQNLPCAVNLKLSKEGLWGVSSTLVRSEIKRILTGRKCCPNQEGIDKPCSEDAYLTYVEVSVEQTRTTSVICFLRSWVVQAAAISGCVWLIGIGCSVIAKKWLGA